MISLFLSLHFSSPLIFLHICHFTSFLISSSPITPPLISSPQCLGAKIGENVCLYPNGGDPMMTEPVRTCSMTFVCTCFKTYVYAPPFFQVKFILFMMWRNRSNWSIRVVDLALSFCSSIRWSLGWKHNACLSSCFYLRDWHSHKEGDKKRWTSHPAVHHVYPTFYLSNSASLIVLQDLVTIGDDSSIDDASLIAHINTRGIFRLNPLTVGKGCVLKSGEKCMHVRVKEWEGRWRKIQRGKGKERRRSQER